MTKRKPKTSNVVVTPEETRLLIAALVREASGSLGYFDVENPRSYGHAETAREYLDRARVLIGLAGLEEE